MKMHGQTRGYKGPQDGRRYGQINVIQPWKCTGSQTDELTYGYGQTVAAVDAIVKVDTSKRD